MYQKIFVKKKYADLLLIGEERKRHYVLIKDFDTFMYDHTLHFCRYCLQAFSIEVILTTALELMANKELYYKSFINSMIEESKYCSDVMKKHLNKELVVTKRRQWQAMEILKALLKAEYVIMIMLTLMLK